jgi:hypothetical protein
VVVSATSAAAIGVVHLTPGGVRAPPRFGWVRRVSIRGGRRSVGADPVRDPAVVVGGICLDQAKCYLIGVHCIRILALTSCLVCPKSLVLDRMRFPSSICELACVSFSLGAY